MKKLTSFLLVMMFMVSMNCYAWTLYTSQPNTTSNNTRLIHTAYKVNSCGNYIKIVKYGIENKKAYEVTLINKKAIASIHYDRYSTVTIRTVDGATFEFVSLKRHKQLYNDILDKVD